MRVVLDSNVIVAAFAARGLCDALFEYCVENHEVALCAEMLEVVERALVRKVKAPPAVAGATLKYLRGAGRLVFPSPIESGVCRDQGDLAVLGAAVAGACDYIITGDADLLSVGKHAGVQIVSPRAFWEKMKGGKEV
jgi:putative PIN family toxin of toxin-antitoxin system